MKRIVLCIAVAATAVAAVVAVRWRPNPQDTSLAGFAVL